jgi:hypothetical protein
MSDLNSNGDGDTFADSHNWRRGEAHQWGRHGGKARSPWACLACGIKFTHYYHDVPNIREAMRRAGIPDQCERGFDDE